MSFADWVQENWPVKLDIIKGDFGGDPNNDPIVSNYGVYPALLYDEFDRKFYLRNNSEWSLVGKSSFSLESLESGQGIRISESFGNEGEIKKIRFESQGLIKALSVNSKLSTLLDSLEGSFYKSFPATEKEDGKVRQVDKGKVAASSSDGSVGSLDEKLEFSNGLYSFPITKANSTEENTLWIGNKESNLPKDSKSQYETVDKVSASPSDKGSGSLYNKIQTGRGLNKYYSKTKKSDESEALRLSLDDDVLSAVEELKYLSYARKTESLRSNDIYVDCKTNPYISLRDGTEDRPYLSIKEAVESEQAQREDCTIWVRSGLYLEEAPITLPPKTSIIGAELRRSRIMPTTNTCGATYDDNGGGTYLFELTHDCIFRNFTIRGVVEPGFNLGFPENADLKNISPYIQNVTSYNDGRDAHQILQLEVTKIRPQTLPNKSLPNLKVISRDATHPNYESSELQPPVIELDREIEKPLRLALGKQYTFEIEGETSRWIRFTRDLDNFSKVDFASETSNSATLDLTNLPKSEKNKSLYYVLYSDAIDNTPSYGEVKLFDPEVYFDDYVFRPGDRVKEIAVEDLQINLERGDSFYIGDEGSFPISYLRMSFEEGQKIEELFCNPLQKRLEASQKVFLFNGKDTQEFELSQAGEVGDIQLIVNPTQSTTGFAQGSSLHYQHPAWTMKFTLAENAPKGSRTLKVGTHKTLYESNSLAYELTDTKELPPNDQLNLKTEINEDFQVGDELWLEEVYGDIAQNNRFPVKVKRPVSLGDKILPVTDAYCRPAENDIIRVQKLLPLEGTDPLEEDLPICTAYIRAGSVIVKDPFQRRNGGGGAHVDGFRLVEGTRLSSSPPKARMMQFNDYTQINTGGYGILCEGIANAECVSVFTYFCNNGLYSRNGGEIRALNCSSGFGVYGVKAEGFLGGDLTKTDPNTPEITAEKIWIGYEYNQELSDTNADPQQVTGDLLNVVATLESPTYNPTQEKTTGAPQIGSLIRVNGGQIAGIRDVERYLRSDGKEYVQIIIGGSWNDVGVDTPFTQEPLGDLNDSNNQDGIFEFRSVVRMTGHDFGYIGSGPRLPRNVGGSGTPIQENETKILDFGQVFWSASDQLGNFTVGEFFRVDQSTGKVSFNTDQFDLTGISELGPFRNSLDDSVGVKLREISNSTNLASERDGRGVDPGSNTVPTQFAVKSYVDQRVGAVIDVPIYYPNSSLVIIGGSSGETYGSIQVLRGITYRFIVEAAEGVTPLGFYVVKENGDPLSEEEGVLNNGATSGSILFTVGFDTPDRYFYRIGNQSIQNPESRQSTLFVRNPDIRLPSGDIGSVQFHDIENTPSGERSVFKGNDNLKVIGNTLQGSFDGIFSGDGQFLENIQVRLGLQDIEGVDLGLNQKEEEDTLVYFGGNELEGIEPEWRIGRAYIPISLADGTTSTLPIKYNIKEGSPEIPFTPGKLEFNKFQSSHLIGVI